MEYLRLLPGEFSNSLTPLQKLTPLKFIFPNRFLEYFAWCKSNLSGLGLFISPAFFFKYGLWWQIWLPSKVEAVPFLICSKVKGWLGRGQTNSPSSLPPHLLGFSRTALAWSRSCRLHGDKSLQRHQLYPARSACELTGFKKNKEIKTLRETYRFIPLPIMLSGEKTTLIWSIGC